MLHVPGTLQRSVVCCMYPAQECGMLHVPGTLLRSVVCCMYPAQECGMLHVPGTLLRSVLCLWIIDCSQYSYFSGYFELNLYPDRDSGVCYGSCLTLYMSNVI